MSLAKQFDESPAHQFVESQAHQRNNPIGGNLVLLWTKQAEAKRWGWTFLSFFFMHPAFAPAGVPAAAEPYRYNANGTERRFLNWSAIVTEGGNVNEGSGSMNQYTGVATEPPWTIVSYVPPYIPPDPTAPDYGCTVDEIEAGPPGFYIRFTESWRGLVQTTELTLGGDQSVDGIIADAKVIYNAATAISALGTSKCFARDGTGTIVERTLNWDFVPVNVLGQIPIPGAHRTWWDIWSGFDTGVFGIYDTGPMDIFRVIGGHYQVDASNWYLDTIRFDILNNVTSEFYTTLTALTGSYDLEPEGLPPTLENRTPKLGSHP